MAQQTREARAWLPVVQALLPESNIHVGMRGIAAAMTGCRRRFCPCSDGSPEARCDCPCIAAGDDEDIAALCQCHAQPCYCAEAEPFAPLAVRPLGWAVRPAPYNPHVRQLVIIDQASSTPAIEAHKIQIYAGLWWHLDASDDWELLLVIVFQRDQRLEAGFLDMRALAYDHAGAGTAPTSFTMLHMLAARRAELVAEGGSLPDGEDE